MKLDSAATIILVVVGLAITIVVFKNFSGFLFFDPIEKYDCAGEILLHQKVTSFSKGNLVSSIRCPTNEVFVKKDVNDVAIKEELAKQMKWCWDSWGKGEYVLFNGTGTFCHVCTMMRFEKRDKEIPNFLTYLTETKVPGTDVTYFEYFYPLSRGERFDTEEMKQQLLKQGEPQLDTEEDLAVLFYYVRGSEKVCASLRMCVFSVFVCPSQCVCPV